MWWGTDLHTESMTALTPAGEVVLAGYNVQSDTEGRGTAQLGQEGSGAYKQRVSGPLSDVVQEGLTVIFRGRAYEIDGRPREYTGSVLDHVEFHIVERFPTEWLTDVVVHRSGGRDRYGNPQPVQEIPLTDCLVRWVKSAEDNDRTDLVDSTAVLYRRRAGFEFRATDTIVVPPAALAPGTWAIDGDPKRWPHTVELALTKDTGGTP